MNVSEIIFAQQSASGLVAVIKWIIQIGSSIAVGIILFTLLLKLITLPFDAVSRVQMRKNSLIMESMRPDLEKLQKQYANDKALYNQKMMALYKKNGYSMFGACLPTIITLVIFIVAINAFTNYSKYQNKVYFLEMSKAYNNAIYAGLTVDGEFDGEYIKQDEKTGKLIFNAEKIVTDKENEDVKDGFSVILEENGGVKYFTLSTSSGYTEYKSSYRTENGKIIKDDGGTYKVDEEKVRASGLKVGDKSIDDYISEEKDVKAFIQDLGSENAAKSYREQIKGSTFLWVKNIWVTDSPMAHPVESSWEKFKSSYSYKNSDESNMEEEQYNLLIKSLSEEREEKNGYFILAILTAGISFLMQFVMSKSQKASMELQTVNGQGAQTQKIMMWMMPIMMAFFAFMYTAAFSIYMILSQFLSIIFTLTINWIIGKKFKLKTAGSNPDVIRGRVYVHETVPEEKGKTKKSNQPEHDFIKNGKGTATTNIIRDNLCPKCGAKMISQKDKLYCKYCGYELYKEEIKDNSSNFNSSTDDNVHDFIKNGKTSHVRGRIK